MNGGEVVQLLAPAFLRIAADMMESQGLAAEAEEVRLIVARVDARYADIIAHEQKRRQ